MNQADIENKVNNSYIVCLSPQIGKNNVNPDDTFDIMAYLYCEHNGHTILNYTLFIRVEDLNYFCDTQVEEYGGNYFGYTTINQTRNYFYVRYNDEDDNRTFFEQVPFYDTNVIVFDSNYIEVSETSYPNISHCNYPNGLISIKGMVEGTIKITTYSYHFMTHFLYLNSESFESGNIPIKIPEDKSWTVISPNIVGNIIIGGECICGNVKDFLTYLQSAKTCGQKLSLSNETALKLYILNDDKKYTNKLDELKNNLYEVFEADQPLNIQIINLIDEEGKIIYR